MVRPAVIGLFAALVLGTSATAALAAGGPHATVVSEPVTFSLPATQCPQLPQNLEPDLELLAEGTLRTTTITSEDGKHFKILARASGQASDNHGGRYRWSYHNSIVGTLGGTGFMTDHFRLTGSGAADGLASRFEANLGFDDAGEITAFVTTVFEGDPFDPATGTPVCDPL